MIRLRSKAAKFNQANGCVQVKIAKFVDVVCFVKIYAFILHFYSLLSKEKFMIFSRQAGRMASFYAKMIEN
ncbi:hypothetical protein F542_3040 [Bibersteinia trehalosi USDA-ARS-USMARC-188]|uniref:Uncharacterized protein n=2 Tax=Bibersteinia trehalosi TaxID=47735 RepID=A0A4V7I7Q7_BIBTR|nr:hypothetical protein WQG_19540 [Bibersteinia trehalosi USDA-ARS-USMARC-192]AHG81022.1 hypothetical protein F542_3040 [Bibersteinia trehalosi USDA-ARS-USMARC-188]AHG83233.1 hypothetical protein F543_3690 [Bibersteinia trehalosi USDA-ARS-USMARC-189]